MEEPKENIVTKTFSQVERKYNIIMDKITPYTKTRWIAFFVCLILFLYRMIHFHKYYIYAYTAGIFILFQFVSFLTPLQVVNNEEPLLPDAVGGEYRPFMRRLSEKKFWIRAFTAVFISLVMSFTRFDLPVFWPILLIYFVILFVVTMQNQIRHMIQHNYVPFDHGKKTYN